MSTTVSPPSSRSPSHSGAASTSGHSGGKTPRQAAVSAATSYAAKAPQIEFVDIPAQDYYSTNVFNKSVMKDRLPKNVYKSLIKTIESGEKLDPEVADVVASAMKDWAMEKGATH